MRFHNIIRVPEEPRRADNEVSQNTSDSEPSTQGRSIGDVRDKSAPTIVWIILLICIMTFIVGSRGNSDVFLDACTFLLYDDTST